MHSKLPSVMVTRSRGLLICLGLLLGAAGAELAVRRAGWVDLDGNFFLGTRHIRPYKIPLRSVRARLQKYQSSPRSLVYDPKLGWAPRPGSRSEDGNHCFDRAGIRTGPATPEHPLKPESGILRIALFGDSFVESAEVGFEQSWGFRLEQELDRAGRRAEVLNFGVPGYGMDQAWLRWQEHGAQYAPQIVVFGLQLENIERNVNLIRPLYLFRSEIPMQKPRFILRAGKLETVGAPPVTPEELPQLLEHVWDWKWAAYENFLNADDYGDSLLDRSRLLSYLRDRLQTPRPERISQLDKEALAAKILEQFKRDVEEHQARFLVVYLPQRNEVESMTRPAATSPFVGEIEQLAPVIHPEVALARQARQTGVASLFGIAHYSPEANRIVAHEVALWLLRPP